MIRSVLTCMLASSTGAFAPVVNFRTTFVPSIQQQPNRQSSLFYLSQHSALHMSSSEDGENKRRRRKRKDVVPLKPITEEKAVAPAPPSPELKARESSPVELEIQDIRGVTAGGFIPETKPSVGEVKDDEDDDEYEDEDEDDDEYEDEYYYEDDDGNEVVVPNEEVDSLSLLLADARQMRTDGSDVVKFSDDKEQGGGGIEIPDSVRNVITSIVTADFFVVCLLLLWFLVGIFAQYVLKDETIQIAFNNRFETIVQPALGVLMIGTAAGALLKEEEFVD